MIRASNQDPQPHAHFLPGNKDEIQASIEAAREKLYGDTNKNTSGSSSNYYRGPSQAEIIQNIYAQQQAAAAALEAQRRAAAQAAYDRSMAALNNSYNTMKNGLNSNYDSTLGQLEQNYNTGVSGVNKQADNAQQQAYINYMMNKRDMGQQLAAQGPSGGASESALAGMYNNYGNSRNTIDSGRNDSLADLMNDWNANKASALQAYNNQLSEMEMQKANAVQQLENNLANLIANAATANYDAQFSLSSDYLSKMMDLASRGGSYASAVANRAYSPTNALLTASTQQGAAAMPTVFNAYQQAQNALDAQMAAANPGLYTVRSTGALPTYTL